MRVNQSGDDRVAADRTRRFSRCMVLVTTLLVAACASPSSNDSQGRTVFYAEDVYTFNSLPQMVATTDTIVVATVGEVTKGRVVGPPGEEVQYLDTSLIIDRVLWGDVTGSQLTVETLELEVHELDWRQPGERVVAFLSPSDPEAGGRFYPTNSQSIFVVLAGDVVRPVVDDEFVKAFAGMPLEEFVALIGRAKKDIALGEVSPQSPPVG